MFKNNKGNNGAAINSKDSPSLIITNCYFDSNKVTENGGAILSMFTNLEINECIFTNNEAKEEGGAVYILNN